MGSVIALRSPGIEDSGEALRIVGKGGKERIIPLRADILQALNEHHADLRVAVDKPVCPLPLIGVIGARPGHRDTPGGALSVNGMYDALKGLFAKAETLATHTAKADFHKASAHWLRHTFAHEVLAATEGDLATTKELLGHESINTTAIYVKAHMGQRQRAIRLLSGPCLSSMQEVPQPSDERQTATTPGSPLIRDSHGHLDNVATT